MQMKLITILLAFNLIESSYFTHIFNAYNFLYFWGINFPNDGAD